MKVVVVLPLLMCETTLKTKPSIGENYHSNELGLTVKGSEEANLNCYEYQLYLFSQRRNFGISGLKFRLGD
jgi:hypothetical protein